MYGDCDGYDGGRDFGYCNGDFSGGDGWQECKPTFVSIVIQVVMIEVIMINSGDLILTS